MTTHATLCAAIDNLRAWCRDGINEPPKVSMAIVCHQAELLSQREESWKLLVEKLRDEVKWSRVDYGFLRAELAAIIKWAEEKQMTHTVSRHPQDIGPEAMALIDTLFNSPSVAQQDRDAHPEEGHQ